VIEHDGLGNPLLDSALYFIQDARRGSVVGNCASWWRENGHGYTCDLNDAGTFTGSHARGLRYSDVAWPVEHVRAHAVTHVRVDIQPMFLTPERQRAIAGPTRRKR
jgi:hypothetical protein